MPSHCHMWLQTFHFPVQLKLIPRSKLLLRLSIFFLIHFVCFVALFVCWNKTRKIYSASCVHNSPLILSFFLWFWRPNLITGLSLCFFVLLQVNTRLLSYLQISRPKISRPSWLKLYQEMGLRYKFFFGKVALIPKLFLRCPLLFCWTDVLSRQIRTFLQLLRFGSIPANCGIQQIMKSSMLTSRWREGRILVNLCGQNNMRNCDLLQRDFLLGSGPS